MVYIYIYICALVGVNKKYYVICYLDILTIVQSRRILLLHVDWNACLSFSPHGYLRVNVAVFLFWFIILGKLT
jgi:hypothetical protein